VLDQKVGLAKEVKLLEQDGNVKKIIMENNKPPRKSLKRRRKAIRAFKKGYKDLGKVKSGEYDREKREFFFNGKDVSLMPTNDADVPITKGIKKRNQGQNFR
jgi:hypothetical protein